MDGTIRCEGLSKQYKEVYAVQSLDLNIERGTIFGFLGRNGAGKTTTIRMLTGLAHPTAGSAWVAGVRTGATTGAARVHFGYLPQDPAFYTWMTPREYLGYVADLFQLPRREKKRRIDEILDQVGLLDAAKRKIYGFSGGMVQRLGIAQAMINQPSVLFLDEPTSALDPAGRYEVLSLIESLRGSVTVFLSSHILADIERVCDTIGIINAGQLMTVESRDGLLNRYAQDIVNLVVEQEAVEQLAPFVTQLEAVEWITAVSQQSNQLSIHIKETAVAKQALLPLITQHNLPILKYEWVRPSLEDIFLMEN